jgi:hypothetical protein
MRRELRCHHGGGDFYILLATLGHDATNGPLEGTNDQGERPAATKEREREAGCPRVCSTARLGLE